VSRWPIRLRLTAAFALATLAVLTGAGVFVYLQVRSELDESLEASLRARADALTALAGPSDDPIASGAGVLEAEESFAQILSPSGRLLTAAGGAGEPALDARRLGLAASAELIFEAEVEGIEATARVLARPASAAPRAPIVAVGQSLDDRDEALAGLLASFALGGPVAVAVASLLGYLLASAALAPVKAMRRRAEEVSLERDDALPLPRADDEIRKLGETLNEMLDRLRAAFERERRFVSDAGHELRTPLAVLKAEIEAALRDGSYGPEVGESLTAALDECDHLAQLADDLLVLARAGEGQLAVRIEKVRAADLLDGMRERFAYRAGQQGRRIAVQADDGLTVAVDPLRIRQALGNLIDNALRHGAGEITLDAHGAGGGSVDLTVADAGAGFPPDLESTAFDRFSRGDPARTRGGAGLGLAIVRAIARAHGGEAEIVATAGATAVRIRLPG
jgi:two-component system, OmpR family, sensor kinase